MSTESETGNESAFVAHLDVSKRNSRDLDLPAALAAMKERTSSLESGYATESSSRPTSGYDFDQAPQGQTSPSPTVFRKSSSSDSTQHIINYITVQITGPATNVQIGSNNSMEVTKAETDKRMVPLSEDFIATLLTVHDPAGEELMFRRLGDESYRRDYVRRMREQDVPSTIMEVGRGCIFLNIQVETHAAAQKLLQMCRDGSYQRILMETFLPEYVTSGQTLEISLAISVKTPDVPPVQVTIVEESETDTNMNDRLDDDEETMPDCQIPDSLVEVPPPGASTTPAKSPQLQRLVASEGRPRQTSSDSGLGSAGWDTVSSDEENEKQTGNVTTTTGRKADKFRGARFNFSAEPNTSPQT
ncbi:Prostaglandin reductase 1 [Branchiostoma belcheri]|nr:Prostaglandin reductase 1 [Branchiostoma belcheri]